MVAELFSLIGAYYYLRVIKVMYFDEPQDSAKIVAHGDVRVLLSLNGVAVLALGLWPGLLMNASQTAIVRSLASFVGRLTP